MEFRYKVHRVSPLGLATVEYRNDDLGSVTCSIIVPADMGEDAVRRTIEAKFPYDAFAAKRASRKRIELPEIVGVMSLDLEEYYS